jgi:hypothetical protein
MKLYKITNKYICQDTYHIKANSKEEAMEIYEEEGLLFEPDTIVVKHFKTKIIEIKD